MANTRMLPILKKVALVKIVARLKDDGGKKDKEEHCWRKGLNPFSLSFWQSGHKQAKDGAEKYNGEAFRQVVELDLKHSVDHEDGEDKGEEEKGNGKRRRVLLLC